MPLGLALALVAAGLVAGSLAEGARATTSASGLPYSDVEGPVADALAALESRGVLAAFPGERFRPDRPITLGEFARAAVAAFGLTLPREPDPQRAAVEALQEHGALAPGDPPDPDLPVSRGALLTAVVELTASANVARQLGQAFAWQAPPASQAQPASTVPLADVAPTDPIFGVALLAHAAGLLPPEYTPKLQPRAAATRGEAAIVLARAVQLQVTEGEVSQTAGGVVVVKLQVASSPSGWGGERPAAGAGTRPNLDADSPGRLQEDSPGVLELDGSSRTVVLRNGRPVGLAELRRGDRATIVSDASGRARLVVALGPMGTAELADRARQALRALARQLTPEQWQAVLRGDWNALAVSLTPQLYDQLMALGVAPWEADALIHRDWPAVAEAAKDRLAREGASRLQVSPEVLRAVLDEDWQAASQLAQQELLQRLLDELLVPQSEGPA